ncbi:hypothetical protein GCM10008941_19860 [Rhizomicrobium palustre]
MGGPFAGSWGKRWRPIPAPRTGHKEHIKKSAYADFRGVNFWGALRGGGIARSPTCHRPQLRAIQVSRHRPSSKGSIAADGATPPGWTAVPGQDNARWERGDVLIAQLCIRQDLELLTADRDFDAIAAQSVLRVWEG